MISEWLTKPLGEIVSFKTGKLDSNASENDGKYPFFTCSPITLRINDFAFDTEAVILAGNNANGVFSTKHYSGKFNAYQRTYVIEPLNLKEVSCRYIYFVISHLVGHLRELAIGTSTKFLTKTILNGLTIRLPPKIEQDQITVLLSSLDDRIALLRETNTTLEAIAQTLFKSWFVDFDPVHAKQQGHEPEGMDSDTAALFPDSFEESELGLVPKGWQTKKINEICDLGRGSSPRPIQKFLGGDVPWIKIADATASDGMFVFETKEKIIQEGVKNSMPVKPGDLIMSNSASCGITVFVELEGCIHDGWLYFKNYQFVTKNFLFFWLRKIAEHLINIADGSVQKNLNIALVSAQPILCPPTDIVMAFENVTSPILLRIRENCLQIHSLSNIRDTLLPRLISGQLRLPETEDTDA